MDDEAPSSGGQGEASPRDERASDSESSEDPMSRVLTVADLPALMRVLGDAAHYTYTLGIQLGLDPHLVRTLKQQAPDDLAKFLSLVLERRMKHVTPPPTLQAICDALSESPIKDEDLAWRLEQYFLNNTCPDQPVMGSTALSPEMAAFSEFLDAVYENAPILFDPKGGPKPSSSYIKLAVTKKEKLTNKKEAIELKDIFTPETGQDKFVLVEGAPGIGKSTFAWELCRRRHEIDTMRAFPAVLYLPLREKNVQEANSVADLLYHDNPRIQQAVVDEITSKGGEDILLVLDGFDEVPVSLWKSSFLAKVIRGQQLPKATILVTSRPSARADLLSLRKPCKHIEVLGFTDELIEQYVSSVYGSNPSLVADFFKYISTNPSIKVMMHVPLNSAIVVEIYQETRKAGKPIPQTMTQLYSELTLSRMSRHLAANTDQSVEFPTKLETLHQELPNVYDQLLSLAKFAFEATLKQEVSFDRLPAGCSTLGLMTTSQKLHRSGKHSTHAFLHLTVQEFLSAFHISQLPRIEQKVAFEQYSLREGVFSHVEMDADMDVEVDVDMVWRFVAGLTGFRNIGWQQSVRGWSRGGSQWVGSFDILCLYEAQAKADPELVLTTPNVQVSFSHKKVSAIDCFAVGYCIAISRHSWEVYLGRGRVGPELEMLAYGLMSKEEVRGSIGILDVSQNPIRREGVTHLGKMPHIVLQQLRDLRVGSCKLDGPACDALSEIIPKMASLTCLDISNNECGSHASNHPESTGGMVKLFQSLACTSQLHTLKIANTCIGRDDIVALARLIAVEVGSLKKLVVGERTQDWDEDAVLEVVLSPSSLEYLRLENLAKTHSFALLKENPNLTELILCRHSEKAHAVNSQGNVQTREERRARYVDRENINALSDALQHNQTLKVVKVPRTSEFSDKEVRTMNSRMSLYPPERADHMPRFAWLFGFVIFCVLLGLFWLPLYASYDYKYVRYLLYGMFTYAVASNDIVTYELMFRTWYIIKYVIAHNPILMYRIQRPFWLFCLSVRIGLFWMALYVSPDHKYVLCAIFTYKMACILHMWLPVICELF